jgi:iron complex transport system ATP-binding protein
VTGVQTCALPIYGIDFALHAGEVLGVVGPNGCGKSTLLRAVTGLIPLRDGEVILGGERLENLPAMERARRCAVQPQVEAPLFDYTVGQFVLLGRHPHRAPLALATEEDRAAVSRALSETDLNGFRAVEPNLEDMFFYQIKQNSRTNAAA